MFAKWKTEDSWPDFLIMSYQMFVKIVQSIEEFYPCLMSDEAHALCHSSSTTYKKTHWYLNKRDRTFLPMTGTPAPNLPTDSYGLIKLLNDKAYASYASFKAMHVDSYTVTTKDDRRFEQINGYINLDLMSRSLFAKGSRVTKDQVLNLETPNIIEEEISLSKQHQELYRKLLTERVLITEDEVFTAVEAQQIRQKALQIVVNPDTFTDEEVKDNEVKNWLAEKLDSIGCEHLEKVVIFARFNKSVEKIHEWFKYLNPALVYGKSNTQENVKKFLTDETCRIMIAHPKSGGVGVDELQSLCKYVIFVEPTSVPGEFTQALDRLVRRGQKYAVVCYILRVLKTPWPRAVDEMRKKMKLISHVPLDRTALLDELLGN